MIKDSNGTVTLNNPAVPGDRIKILVLPLEDVHPHWKLCAIDAQGDTYCHPEIIGRDCVRASADARVNIFIQVPTGYIPLVPIKWARENFKDCEGSLDLVDRSIRLFPMTLIGLN
jgi:hypothetical protein